MLDVDHFKRLNDACGHDAGDTLLCVLARLLESRVRDGDIACRYGGEEFVLIVAEAPLEMARRRAEEVRDEVRRLRVTHRGQLIGAITASAGVAAFPDHGKTSGALLQAADAALYQAKAQGRDRVIVARANSRTSPRNRWRRRSRTRSGRIGSDDVQLGGEVSQSDLRDCGPTQRV